MLIDELLPFDDEFPLVMKTPTCDWLPAAQRQISTVEQGG